MFNRRYKKVGKKQSATAEPTLPVPPPPQSVTSDSPWFGSYHVMENQQKRFKNSQTQSDDIEAAPLPPLPTDLGDYETVKKVTQV